LCFRAAVQRDRDTTEPGRAPTPHDLKATKEQRATDRKAIRRALEELGYLWYATRRIPLPIQRKKTANITMAG